MKENVYLPSKPRFEVLDGLRGVAALLVVAYHLLETYFHGGPAQPLNHGYLAVDFFFALSGFVMGYAYDDRADSMSVGAFLKRRFIRLHPMLVFGSVIGALLFYYGDGARFPLVSDTPWYTMLLVLAWTLTIIPLPASLDIRGWAETNPLNGPVWSLQWEYLANLLYVFLFRRMPRAVLAVFVGAFACLTLSLCLNLDFTGLLAGRAGGAYTVVGGWCLTADQLFIGAVRLLFPFFSGLLLARLGWRIRLKGGTAWCVALTVAALAMPWMGLDTTGTARWTNGLYEAVCILLVFPLILVIGAGSSLRGAKSQGLNKLLGDISYPLYLTHFPLVCMQMTWADNHPDAPASTHAAMTVGTFVFALLMAYASFRLYDVPVREWLKRKLFRQA